MESIHRPATNVVGVRFNPEDPVSYFDPGDQEFEVGDRVVADTADGTREGRVVIAPAQVIYSELRGALAPARHKKRP